MNRTDEYRRMTVEEINEAWHKMKEAGAKDFGGVVSFFALGIRHRESELLPRIAELEAEVAKLRKPWVSVKERMPNNEQLVEAEVQWIGRKKICYAILVYGSFGDHEWETADCRSELSPFVKVTQWRAFEPPKEVNHG